MNIAYVNFGALNVAGLDYRLTYRLATPLGAFTPSLAVTQTYRYEASLTPSSPAINAVSVAQDTGNWAPRWKGTLSVDWHWVNWNAYLAGRYVGKYQDYDSSRIIGNFWLVDASVRYALGHVVVPESKYGQNLTLRFGAVNLFNRAPQFSNYQFDFIGYDPTQADIRGRFVYAQLGVRW